MTYGYDAGGTGTPYGSERSENPRRRTGRKADRGSVDDSPARCPLRKPGGFRQPASRELCPALNRENVDIRTGIVDIQGTATPVARAQLSLMQGAECAFPGFTGRKQAPGNA